MNVYIILTIAGTDVGPFDLYSDVDGFVTAFETGVSRADLVAGYTSVVVPIGTTQIKVQSTGDCTNYIIIDVATPTTSTTSTTTSTTSTTTTTTTTVSVTTTTTTTVAETFYRITQCAPLSADFTIAKTETVNLGDILAFNTIPPDGNNYCGEIVDVDFPTGPPTATLISPPVVRECGDAVHCYQAPV